MPLVPFLQRITSLNAGPSKMKHHAMASGILINRILTLRVNGIEELWWDLPKRLNIHLGISKDQVIVSGFSLWEAQLNVLSEQDFREGI